MYPDKQSVERLEEDVEQPLPHGLAGDEPGTEAGNDEEKLQDADEQD